MNDRDNVMKLYSISSAAKELHIRKTVLSDLISTGRIGVIYIGSRKKVPRIELERFIHDNTIRIDYNPALIQIQNNLRCAKLTGTSTQEFIKQLRGNK